MAGAQIEISQNRLEKGDKGFLALSLTEYDTTAECEIAEGSIVEIAGALFEFTADEAITGWAGIGNSNDVYVKCVVAGTAVTAEFTTTAPTYSTSKAGWYGTAGAALHRYVAKLYKDGAGAYTLKCLYRGGPEIRSGMIGSGQVATANLAALAVVNSKLSKTLDSGGSQDFASTDVSWVPDAGLYVAIAINAGGDRGVCMQVYQGGSWRGAGTDSDFTSGVILADGSNVRLTSYAGTGTVTVYYLKLA